MDRVGNVSATVKLSHWIWEFPYTEGLAMRGQLVRASLLFSALLFVSTAVAAERIAWETNLDQAWDAAVAEQKPLLIFITRDKCKFCTKMKKTTLIDPRVVGQVGTRFVPLMLNSADEQRLVRDLKITSFPTTVVIATDKSVVQRIKGHVTAKDFEMRLAEAERRAETLERRALASNRRGAGKTR